MSHSTYKALENSSFKISRETFLEHVPEDVLDIWMKQYGLIPLLIHTYTATIVQIGNKTEMLFSAIIGDKENQIFYKKVI